VNTTLADALKQLDLRPGETRLVTVNGYQVEVRRLETAPPPAPAGEPSQFADADMLDVFLNVPPSPRAVSVPAKFAPLPLPDPPVILPEDETAEGFTPLHPPAMSSTRAT
jgi:hypothetical protein